VPYAYGYKDLCLLFFYTIAAIIFHAVIQEYVLDKLMRKVRLSKTKANKFNESGQLLAFYTLSVAWALYVFREEGYFQTLSFFWTDYPHVGITFLTKFFFIIQMSYWIHVFPELYFQKVKKEDMTPKIVFATIHLAICAAIYYLNFTRIGLTLLFIDYFINALFHVSRLLHFSDLKKASKISFNIFNILFVLARFASAILAIFVFWFGLQTTSQSKINWETRNFNTPYVRWACLGVAVIVQVLALYQFIMFQLKKIRENSRSTRSKQPSQPRKPKAAVHKEKEESSETETDQHAQKNGDAVKAKSN